MLTSSAATNPRYEPPALCRDMLGATPVQRLYACENDDMSLNPSSCAISLIDSRPSATSACARALRTAFEMSRKHAPSSCSRRLSVRSLVLSSAHYPLEQPGLSQMVNAIDAFYREVTASADGARTLP
ncbi:hypothetical protein [Burkholderia multivorans]|uniref:hypothetical protein n=1 Tax=Burkholderia multivorans TaxID=87883 RepID=UPI003C7C223F